MFIHDYINKLENDFKMLFPDKVPLVVDDAANFIDGKYFPKDNEFVIVVNTGNATIEKIQNIKSFSSSIYLYVYIPFTERDTFQEELVNYLVEQSDNDTLYPVGEYTAGFAFNTPSCDGKAKKINGKDYALYIVMGSINYVKGLAKFENDIYINGTKLDGIINMGILTYPVIETVPVIGKCFSDTIEQYRLQEINISVLLNFLDKVHKDLIIAAMGGETSIHKRIMIKNSQIKQNTEFMGNLKLQMVEYNKAIKIMNITISR